MNATQELRPPAVMIRQGLVLLAGAVVIVLAIGDDGRAFYSTPFALGVTYLVTAAAGGRRGGYWAGALVLCGFGGAVLVVRHAHPDLDTSGLYLLGAGVGATVACLLARAGFSADPLGASATVAITGAVLAFAAPWAPRPDARASARLVGRGGVDNGARGVRPERAADAEPV